MKKHYTIALALIITSVLAITGIQTAKAQTTVYYQSFDSVYALPTGWTSDIAGDNTGTPWAIDSNSSNSSYTPNGTDGYAGASGLYNVIISNPTTGTVGTFAFTSILYTCNIPTTNWKNIEVGWGARNTKHFMDSGSEIQGFYMSTDGGSTWDSIPYIENQANSYWFWDNNGSNIDLPSSADHQANLMFKWVADLYVTASGTYRIDDFTVLGTSSPAAAVDNVNDKPNALVYLIGNSTINVVAKDLQGQQLTVELFDMVGHNLRTDLMTTETMSMNVSNLASGIYLVRVTNGTSSQVTKVAINR